MVADDIFLNGHEPFLCQGQLNRSLHMQISKSDGNNNKIIEFMKVALLFGHANEIDFVWVLCNAVLIKVGLQYLDVM